MTKRPIASGDMIIIIAERGAHLLPAMPPLHENIPLPRRVAHRHHPCHHHPSQPSSAIIQNGEEVLTTYDMFPEKLSNLKHNTTGFIFACVKRGK